MENYLMINDLKIGEFIENIKREIELGTDFKIVCFDIDNTIINEKTLKEELIKLVDIRATREYRDRISFGKTSEDVKVIDKEFYDRLDRVLEEVDSKYKGKMNFDRLYNDSQLFPYVREYVNELLNNRPSNVYYIIVSHYNPIREAIKKITYFSKLFPNIDAIFTVPFHKELYSEKADRKMNSKAEFLLSMLPFPNVSKHIYFVDDSHSVTKDNYTHGIKSIPFLPNGRDGIVDFNPISNHAGMVTSLNPIELEMAMNYHDYYYEQMVQDMEAAKIKKI